MKETTMAQNNALQLTSITHIWFDLDDTLYDFSASSLIALQQIYEQFELNRWFPNLDCWIDIYHRHNAQLWKLYNAAEIDQATLRHDRFSLPFAEVGAPVSETEPLNDSLDKVYLQALARTGITLPGALEVVRTLKARGYFIGILSNGFAQVQHAKLVSSRLSPYINKMVLSDDIGVNKPDRRIFDYALSLTEASPRQTLLIGDNPETDIAGAINAGWEAMLFSAKSNQAEMVINNQPIPVVSHLADILISL